MKYQWDIPRMRSADRRRIRHFLTVSIIAALAMPSAAGAEVGALAETVLVKSGEVRGFEPGKIQVFRSASAVKNAAGEGSARSTVERYETEGFVEAAIVRLHSRTEPAAKGIASVIRFETPTAAKAEMKAELKEDLDPQAIRKEGVLRYFTLKHFKVPGVSKAIAYAFITRKVADDFGLRSGIAKGFVVEGSCLFSVGIYRPKSNAAEDPVAGGVQAMSRRAVDICP